MPISIKSTPLLGSFVKISKDVSISGSPAVKKMPKAFLLFFLRFSNVFFRYYGYYECQIVFGYDRCMTCHVAYFM